MNTIRDFKNDDRVKWLSFGEYRTGTVVKVARKYVTVASDAGTRHEFFPSALRKVAKNER